LLEFRRIGRTFFTVDWLVDKGSASAGNRRPLLKEALDLSQRHALGVFGDNFLIKSTKASLPLLGDKLRFKLPSTVPRSFDLQLALFAQQGLGAVSAIFVLFVLRLRGLSSRLEQRQNDILNIYE
jgi:hypothetical protein